MPVLFGLSAKVAIPYQFVLVLCRLSEECFRQRPSAHGAGVFADVFKPDDIPRADIGVKYAVLVDDSYQSGVSTLERAIILAGAYLTTGHTVTIACADPREIING